MAVAVIFQCQCEKPPSCLSYLVASKAGAFSQPATGRLGPAASGHARLASARQLDAQCAGLSINRCVPWHICSRVQVQRGLTQPRAPHASMNGRPSIEPVKAIPLSGFGQWRASHLSHATVARVSCVHIAAASPRVGGLSPRQAPR